MNNHCEISRRFYQTRRNLLTLPNPIQPVHKRNPCSSLILNMDTWLNWCRGRIYRGFRGLVKTALESMLYHEH